MAGQFVKDPQAVLDYQWDWSLWLAVGETISTATVTVPTGITLASSTSTTTTVTAWLSSGTVGADYTITCHIVTNQGRTDERNIFIMSRER